MFDMAFNAAVMALNAAKTPFEAIQLLELGRGVVAGSLNHMRSDISELQNLRPQLAKRLISLRDQLDSLSISHPKKNLPYTASKELEQLAQEIRALPGFDRFLLPPSEHMLKSAARDGLVVIIDMSAYRCDTLIIQHTRTHSLALPGLQAKDIRRLAKSFLGTPETFQWLWSNVTQPMLKELGFADLLSMLGPISGGYLRDYWPNFHSMQPDSIRLPRLMRLSLTVSYLRTQSLLERFSTAAAIPARPRLRRAQGRSCKSPCRERRSTTTCLPPLKKSESWKLSVSPFSVSRSPNLRCVEMAARIYEWIVPREMTDATTSEGLHEASRLLRRHWIEDHHEEWAFDDDGTGIKTPTRSADQIINDSRDVTACEDVTLSPPHWVSYVHFGG
ncbi:hypothetical protein F4782DRAFT_497153 [Xylaria castorea]|nr:hypothetical protein F4782DRAFT_497153 [Xylaria castorea]